MRTFEDVFRENMIRIQDVEDLTDKDFEKLGVTAIGLQLRVKQACRNQRQEDTSEINLNQLLAFWTGADTIPPLGFHKKLEIKFVEDPALLPVAHTCDLSLELSRGETPEEFHRKMELAITCGGEFHLA
ncbi:G2/M phase-specific E3 ubiquitin-protein ligase-like isoform X1 [Crassostrea virginica]|uniref:Uncharacterized protein LOC111112282 n=1 Tax=Crassostrea virginica TaxID=6565 RepID=A0A8B8BRB9_CRAVI|nr:uncharacterized protein LOC111112282 [Crassostrea virginica]